MKVTNDSLKQSMLMKDIIRDALLIKPMSYSELLVHFNLERGKLTNHMTQLKKYGFVKYSESEKKIAKDKRKYYAVSGIPSYAQMMSELRAINSQMIWKDAHKSELLPNARFISFEDKSFEDKLKAQSKYCKRNQISAWQGYTSLGGL